MTKDSSVRSGGVAFDDLPAHLLAFCVDWDGSEMPDAEDTRIEVDCWTMRAAAKRIAILETALGHFVNLRDQFPQSMKLIQKSMDGFTPITVTVTKAQFSEAWSALHKGNPNVQG